MKEQCVGCRHLQEIIAELRESVIALAGTGADAFYKLAIAHRRICELETKLQIKAGQSLLDQSNGY